MSRNDSLGGLSSKQSASRNDDTKEDASGLPCSRRLRWKMPENLIFNEPPKEKQVMVQFKLHHYRKAPTLAKRSRQLLHCRTSFAIRALLPREVLFRAFEKWRYHGNLSSNSA